MTRALFILLAACGAPDAPLASANEPRPAASFDVLDASSAVEAAAAPSCPDGSKCLQLARAARTRVEALPYYQAACMFDYPIGCYDGADLILDDDAALTRFVDDVCGNGPLQACHALALQAMKRSDKGISARAYVKACQRATSEKEATYSLTNACERALNLLIPRDEHEAALAVAQTACATRSTIACIWLGAFYDLGRGVPLDPKRAQELYTQGCAGVAKCTTAYVRRAVKEGSDLDLPVAGANVTIDDARVGTFLLLRTSCKTTTPIAAALLAAPFAAKQKELDACVPKGGGAHVKARFTVEGGKLSHLDVHSNPPDGEACVAKIMTPMRVPLDGTCHVEFGIGLFGNGVLH